MDHEENETTFRSDDDLANKYEVQSNEEEIQKILNNQRKRPTQNVRISNEPRVVMPLPASKKMETFSSRIQSLQKRAEEL